MALLHGSFAEKYEVLARLRQGGMGAVYKVRHRLLDELRVVKVIRSWAVGGEEAEARFLQEARVASRLRHPNLAVLHDFAVDEEGDAYLVSEFIDGWTFRELLRRQGPPPLAIGLETGRQALKALGHLHRNRIVHRDVSPDNLMLTRDEDGLPFVKLIDLGIAKALEDGAGPTASGVFLGKPRYASPEQFGPNSVDERSDLYSFGVVLYELLTGRCPIEGHDPLSLMAGHLSRPPLSFEESDPEGRIPADLREILLGALEKRPLERIPTAEEFAGALAEVQSRHPVSETDLAALFGLPAAAEATAAAEPEPSDTLYLRAEEAETTRSGSLPLAAASAPRPASSPADEVIWDTARPGGGGPFYEPLDEAGAPAVSPPGATPDSSPLLFRLALITAAVLVLLIFVQGFWRMEESEPEAPEWAAAPHVPAQPAEKPAPAPRPAEPPAFREMVDDPSPAIEEEPEPQPAPAIEEEEIAQAEPEPPPAPAPSRPAPTPPPALARRTSQPWEEGTQPPDLLKPGPGVEEPVPLDLPRFAYPAEAHGTGSVDVRLALLVDERGRVIEARVREGTPPDLGFEETALAVARRIPFQPATRYDVPGKMWTEVILEFVE